jgi:type IV pilus assembly protein PilC
MWKWKTGRIWRRRRLDKEKFFYEKSVYLENGIGITEALKLSEDDEDRQLRDMLLEGTPLSEAFRRLEVFNERELGIIRLSEETGTIGKTFRELHEDLRENRELSNRIRTILIYPAILFVTSIVFLYSAIFFIIPPLHDLVRSIGSGSRVMGFIVTIAQAVPYQAGAAFSFLLCFLVIRAFFSREIVLSLVLGTRKKRYLEHLFIREFHKLLSSGMDIYRALGFLTGQEFRGAGLVRRLGKGEDLMTAFRGEGFSEILVSYVRMAEETGDVLSALGAYSGLQKRYFEDYLKKKTALIEPVAIALMGLLVLGVAAAVLLPMLDAYEAI